MQIKTFHIRGRDIRAAVPDEYIESYWRSAAEGRWESDAYSVFDRYVDRQTVCFDLGAYIGFTCCYLAGLSKATHAFEPDPEAFRILEATAAANAFPNLHVHPFAAGMAESTVRIMSAYSGGNSGSSLLMLNPKTSWEVRMVDVGQFIDAHAGGAHIFMKIDIEGYEYRLLRALLPVWKRHRATVFLALHPQILSRLVEGKTVWSKLRRRIRLLGEHLPLLRIQAAAREIHFASGADPRHAIRRILLSILLHGDLPADRKELVLRF
jgi:FkbM family methyltransferase